MNTLRTRRLRPPTIAGRASKFRHAVLRRLSGHDERARGRFVAGYQWALLSPADARYVDRCLRLSRLENDWNASRELFGGSAGLATPSARAIIEDFKLPKISGLSTRPRPMSGSSAGPRLTARQTMTQFAKYRPASKSRRFPVGQAAAARRSEDRSHHRHENAAEDSSRYDARGPLLCLRGRTSEGQSAAYHRSANLAQMKRIGIEPGKSFDFDNMPLPLKMRSKVHPRPRRS